MPKRMTLGQPPMMPELGIRSSLLKWLDDRPARMAFSANTAVEARAWQRRARAAFEKCLGEPLPSVEPRVTLLEDKQLDGYRRTMFTLDTAPHMKALCWLCVPDELKHASKNGRSPAMIATPGHGSGAKSLLALDDRGKPRKEGDGYQKDHALAAVRLGYPVLVIEPMGFGERRDRSHAKKNAPEQPCYAAANLALALGTTLARIRINDIQRGIDHLQTLSLIDPARIGLMGISCGGQITLWTSAVEPRLKVAIVSGYFNEMRASILGMYHCLCNFVPALARELDMTDLGTLVAPRPMLIESGAKDQIFPIAATRRAIGKLRKVYELFGAADHLETDLFGDSHQWSGRKVKPFLKRWL